MQYNVTFGSAFAIDQFGFIRKGIVKTEGDTIVFSGKKSLSTTVKPWVLLAITILVFLVCGLNLAFILALVAINFVISNVSVSNGSLTVQKYSIVSVERKGRQIKFNGTHPESGKVKKTVFKVDTEENASKLEAELKNK